MEIGQLLKMLISPQQKFSDIPLELFRKINKSATPAPRDDDYTEIEKRDTDASSI